MILRWNTSDYSYHEFFQRQIMKSTHVPVCFIQIWSTGLVSMRLFTAQRMKCQFPRTLRKSYYSAADLLFLISFKVVISYFCSFGTSSYSPWKLNKKNNNSTTTNTSMAKKELLWRYAFRIPTNDWINHCRGVGRLAACFEQLTIPVSYFSAMNR